MRNWCERPVWGVSSSRVRSTCRSGHAQGGQHRTAQVMVDFVPRRVLEILDERRVHLAALAGHNAKDDGHVALFHGALAELCTQCAMRLGVAGQHHDAGGIAVESMYDPRAGYSRSTREQAVGQQRPQARLGQ